MHMRSQPSTYLCKKSGGWANAALPTNYQQPREPLALPKQATPRQAQHAIGGSSTSVVGMHISENRLSGCF